MRRYDLLPHAREDILDLAAYASEYRQDRVLVTRMLRQERDVDPETFSESSE